MQWKTHLIGGVAIGCGAILAANSQILGLPEGNMYLYAGMICASCAGSMAPDIDVKTSKIGKKTKMFSWLVNVLIGHRTLFHAPLLYLLLYLIVYDYSDTIHLLSAAFFAGAISHLILDMMNPMGIPVLYPIKHKFKIANIHTGGKGEKVVCWLLTAATAGILYFTVITLYGKGLI